VIRPLLTLNRLRPPIRRVAAVDPGDRCLKLLLAESDFGRVRIRHRELIDLKAEGLVSPEEIKTHVLATLDSWGSPPIVLVLSQHLSTSQVIDVPLAPESEVKKLIEDETVRLTGVSESRIVYDFVRIETAAKNRQQFWVTLCQEGDIRERIGRLGLEQEDLSEVTTTANALIAAYRASAPDASRAILVHLGAQTTVVVVLLAGQGAFATSFQMGGDFFTRSLARERNCSDEAAEELKRGTNLLSGPKADAPLVTAVDGWVAELNRQLKDWFDRNPAVGAERAGFQFVGSGGGFDQPGLLEYLKSRAGLNLRGWPSGASAKLPQPAKGFEIAFGAALQALGYSAQPVSLLPEDYRIAWQKRVGRQRLEFASLLLVGICILIFALGTWHNLSLISRKQALLSKVQAGQDSVDENDALTSELLAEYESVRPVFAAKQNTLDTLKTLSLLQQARTNRSCWYTLIADQQSYFTLPLPQNSTNKPARTNLLGSTPNWALPGPFSSQWSVLGNASPARAGIIAELCIPEEAEAARRATISQIVRELQQQGVFSKADQLSEDQRRPLADPKVIIPEREFVLTLEFAETDFQKPALGRRGAGLPSSRGPKRPRPAPISPGTGETGSENPR